MPILEAKANGRYTGDAGYEHYRSTTSPLVPMPPSWYAAMPGTYLRIAYAASRPTYGDGSARG